MKVFLKASFSPIPWGHAEGWRMLPSIYKAFNSAAREAPCPSLMLIPAAVPEPKSPSAARVHSTQMTRRMLFRSAIPETIGIATPHGHWALAIHSLNPTRRYMVSLHVETIGKSLLKIPCWLQVKDSTLVLERI